MHVGALNLHLRLPGCDSLKAKRGRLKPLLSALHRSFNIAAAEVDLGDSHTQSVIACVAVSNDGGHVERVLAGIPGWIEHYYPDVQVVDHEYTPL
jgi:uncharacterized protein YlxP (DUF503 family)